MNELTTTTIITVSTPKTISKMSDLSETFGECAKCKIERKAYITDQDPLTLQKYKTCDHCRKMNQHYKRNQKLKLMRKLESIKTKSPIKKISNNKQVQQNDNDDDLINSDSDLELSNNNTIIQQKLKKSKKKKLINSQNNNNNNNTKQIISDLPIDLKFDDFELFLKKISINGNKDVISIKFNTIIPNFIIKTINKEDIVKLYNGGESLLNKQGFKENIKNSLKIHYLNRIFDILNINDYNFKIRSNNWKIAKFYCQMICQKDTGSKNKDISSLLLKDLDDDHDHNESQIKQNETQEVKTKDTKDTKDTPSSIRFNEVVKNPRNTVMFRCHSKLNYSYDTVTGKFNIEYSHLSHKGLFGTNSTDSRSVIHNPNTAESITQQWLKTLEQNTTSESHNFNINLLKLRLQNQDMSNRVNEAIRNGSNQQSNVNNKELTLNKRRKSDISTTSSINSSTSSIKKLKKTNNDNLISTSPIDYSNSSTSASEYLANQYTNRTNRLSSSSYNGVDNLRTKLASLSNGLIGSTSESVIEESDEEEEEEEQDDDDDVSEDEPEDEEGDDDEEPDDKSQLPVLTPFASALNELHINISGKNKM
ncbi:hypothetical protein B5S32_g3675 [[Candida] boidinii]|nr:hypothetical protein B5S32_g3675 [[Candida] boidinii]